MGFYTLFVLAIGLSFDSFAVSVSSGIIRNRILFFDASKIAFSLAFFQGTMPVIGWFLGRSINETIAEFDHWIAFSLLGLLGLRMIVNSLRDREETIILDPLRPAVLLTLSIATSIDALVVGISFAFFEINIIMAVLLIGGVTFIVSMLGILFGKKIGTRFGNRIEILGGVIMIAIGVKILLEHLLSTA